jgi:hypothetical protein
VLVFFFFLFSRGTPEKQQPLKRNSLVNSIHVRVRRVDSLLPSRPVPSMCVDPLAPTRACLAPLDMDLSFSTLRSIAANEFWPTNRRQPGFEDKTFKI